MACRRFSVWPLPLPCDVVLLQNEVCQRSDVLCCCAGDYAGEDVASRDSSSSGTNAEIQSQLLQCADKAFLCANPNRETVVCPSLPCGAVGFLSCS